MYASGRTEILRNRCLHLIQAEHMFGSCVLQPCANGREEGQRQNAQGPVT